MAETETSAAEDEETVRQRIEEESNRRDRKPVEKSPKKCRPIYDRLSMPNRRLILALYQNHAYHLPKEKVEKIKERLQEMYAMTPEETERYFQELMERSYEAMRRRAAKKMLRKEYLRRKRQQATARAYRFAEKILRLGMTYSYYNHIPPLVSIRLRHLSNIILEQICELRNVEIPRRDTPQLQEMFLVSLADWLAIAIEKVYYRVQLKKNKELEEIEKEKEKMEKQRKGSPVLQTASTAEEKRKGGEEGEDRDEYEEDGVRGERAMDRDSDFHDDGVHDLIE